MIKKSAGDSIAYRLLVLLTVVFLSSCHFDEEPSGIEGSGTRKSPPPPTPAPSPAPTPGPSSTPGTPHTHGRFIGTVKIGNTTYFGDALITVDGAVRLFVGAPGSNDGALQVIKPSVSEQFVGTVTLQGTAARGTGVVLGQYCAGVQVPGPYCGKNASGEIHLNIGSAHIQGDVQVANGAPEWILDLGYWPNYYEQRTGSFTGELREHIAEFSTNGDTVISFYGDGSLFFQSASSGCVGNGAMRPHLDGHYGVYDISLILANCKPPYTYLNGEYAGLAADSAGNYWDYDEDLRIWVSSTTAGVAAPALTMLAVPAL